MNVAVYDHRGVAQPFIDALDAAGHTVLDARHRRGDLLVVDLDHPNYHHMIDAHEHTVLIPHGAGPVTSPVDHPHVDAVFVVGDGNVANTDAADVHVIGWPWTLQAPFRPRTEPLRILFAPTHPDNDGHIEPRWKAAEERALELTIAAIPNQLLLTYRPGPSTIQAAAAAVAKHDLVVAAPGSILAIAVASGVPAVAYHQELADDIDFGYPWDLRDGVAAIQHALTAEAVDWRARYVGDRWDPAGFVDLIEAHA